MTKAVMKELSEIRASCDHSTAEPRDHRCSSCLVILRRCCYSALGAPHEDGCGWARKFLALKKAAEALGEQVP